MINMGYDRKITDIINFFAGHSAGDSSEGGQRKEPQIGL
jgi:hypothetical protein